MLPASLRSQVCLNLPVEACLKIRAESFETSKTDSLANFPHDVKVKVEIVVGVQDGGKRFPGGIKVPQIGTGIPSANRASAGLVDRPLVFRKLRIADQQAPL